MGTNLADRVAANTGRDVARRTDTAPAEQPPKELTLAEQIEQWKSEFELVIPGGGQQLVRDAMQLMRTTKHLDKCDAPSVIGGLITFAQLGLRPGVLGHGWLIPFKKRVKIGPGRDDWADRYTAQVVFGYKGLVELGHRSPMVARIIGRAVHKHDEFEVEYGTDERIVHRPAKGDRGEVVGYYSIIWLVGSSLPTMWHMTRDEAIEWRNKFATSVKRDYRGNPQLDDKGEIQGSGPWFDMDNGPEGASGFDQQAIKTTFLRAARWMPKGTDPASLQLARAVEVDGKVRQDTDPGDPDGMFRASYPDRGDVVNGDVVPEQAGGAARPPAAAQQPTVVSVGEPAGGVQVDFPPVAPSATDGPALESQQKRMHVVLGEHGMGDDTTRWAVLARIAGRSKALMSASDLSKREAAQVCGFLADWAEAGTLRAQLHAVRDAATAAAPAQAEKLPDVGTKAWHDAQHPRRDGGGPVTTVPSVNNGDCGICEEIAAEQQ